MTKELDILLESIEGAGGFRDVCTVFHKTSVEALEQGMEALSNRCQIWRVIFLLFFSPLYPLHYLCSLICFSFIV